MATVAALTERAATVGGPGAAAHTMSVLRLPSRGRALPGTMKRLTMPDVRRPVHPYIPNSEPRVKAAMLAAIGAADIEELYDAIPPTLRLDRPLDLPAPADARRRRWSGTSKASWPATGPRART